VLTKTFCHVPGVGDQTERVLWAHGCDSWQTFLDNPCEFPLGTANRDTAVAVVEQSIEALETRNHQFFRDALGAKDAWRTWPEFRDSCVYLDIETDGGMSGDAITLVGLYDGAEFTCLQKDEDLGNFLDILSRYSLIVTFFGTGFDLPMLQRAFPTLQYDQIHLDLCYALRRVGLKGGLKSIEQQLGIARSEDTTGLSGRDAITLWRLFQRGDESALETLIAYNREDVVNLETLAGIAFDRLSVHTLEGRETPVVQSTRRRRRSW